LEEKIDKIYSLLKGKKIIIAFSGGVDSSVVASLAKKVAKSIICVTFFNPIYLKEDYLEAKKVAQELEIKWERMDITDIPESFFKNNPSNRCYICKKILMTHLLKYKNKIKYDIIVDGTNFDDLKEYRPGINALNELGIISPLAISEINKKEVRLIAENLRLSVFNKPSGTCLLSRIPYNQQITLKKLEMIRQSEKLLKNLLNSKIVRVRHYEINKNINLARIEIQKEDFIELFNLIKNNLDYIIKELKKVGYNYITIDLEGYRSGSMDSVN